MRKYVVMLLIIVSIILLLSIMVHAAYAEPLPGNPYGLPYVMIMYWREGEHSAGGHYHLVYSSEPFVIKSEDAYGDGTGYLLIGLLDGHCDLCVYEQPPGHEMWIFKYYEENVSINWAPTDIVYCNYAVGITTFELEENHSSFFGIDFDYSNFFGDLKLTIGKKQEDNTYKEIKEWVYPPGAGHVSIPADEIPQGNTGEYIITIYEGDTIISQYPYVLNVEKESYCEINYPVNGQSYNYYPNVSIRYNDMGKLYLYINGEMYKQIQTKDREGIEVIDGNNDLFDIGMNTVSVKDNDGQVVATVQYEVLREGLDPGYELPEFEAESWVKELFNRIMNEYSMFFEYVRGIYAFLPVELIGLVGIIMMLSVILWFTGRK